MMSVKSCFSVSGALIAENIRRFWVISAFAFAGYFFTGVFPMLISGLGQPQTVAGVGASIRLLAQIAAFQYPPYIIFACVFPMIAAVALFRYLHISGAASVMHAMPFTRHSLFNSHFISGAALLLPPVWAASLLLIAIRASLDPGQLELLEFIDAIPGAPDVLRGALSASIVICFLFSVCVMAGTVSGNSAVHVVAGMILNVLPPTLCALIFLLSGRFLFGFAMSESLTRFLESLSPLSLAIAQEGRLGLSSAVYALAFLAVAAVASFLYSKRKLERAGDSLTFRFMEHVVCYFIAILGMAAMGAYFDQLADGDAVLYLGMAVGAFIAFVFARMIAKKTPRIWNRPTWRDLGVFSIIAALLVAGARFDVLGYERRVPNAERVSHTYFYPAAITPGIDKVIFDATSANPWNNQAFSLGEPENIRAATAFHRRVVENLPQLKAADASKAARESGLPITYDFTIRYEMDSGMEISRLWPLPLDFIRSCPGMKALIESPEFKSRNSFDNPAFGNVSDVQLTSRCDERVDDIRLSLNEAAQLIDCVTKDMLLESYDEFSDLRLPLVQMTVAFRGTEVTADIDIPHSYENTVRWFKDAGYYDQLTQWSRDVVRAELTHRLPSGEVDATYPIRDKELAGAAFSRAESASLGNDGTWRLTVSLPEYYSISHLPGGRPTQIYSDDELNALIASGQFTLPTKDVTAVLNEGNPALEMLLSALGH